MVKIKNVKSKSESTADYDKLESFDDFLETLSNDEEDSSDDEEKVDDNESNSETEENNEVEVSQGSDGSENGEVGSDDGEVDSDEVDGSDTEMTTLKEHKEALKNLEKSDPEFFSYLKENDAELLNFDDEEEDSTADEDEDEAEEAIHKPTDKLEVASDSEAEEDLIDEESKEHKQKLAIYLKKGIVNLNVITEWEKRLTTSKELSVLSNVIEAFECAVESILKEEGSTGLKWRVEGSGNFNSLMRLCIRHVKGFCVRFLCGSNNTLLSEKRFDENPYEMVEKSKGRWTRLRPKIKNYMKSLVTFLKSMGNPEAITAVLRHCQKMSGFWALMTTKSYKLLKIFINIWSTGEDSCRVAGFLCIIRMANYNKEIYLTRVFKQMYMAYVANCKFTSVNTWPFINFMRSSLVEVYLLDTAVCYSVAFPFIRQLAIHLRNAVTAGTTEQPKQGKKEASRIVYSWQFLHSVHVWSDLLAQAVGTGDENLRLLVYPVVQICLGTIKLIPTRKYIPLRFHIIRMLITLQEKTRIFIPILPLVTEVLNLTDFGGKTVGKFSLRPLDMHCCLKADSTESGYFKAISEAVFDSILGTCKAIGTELAFPEILCPTLIHLKSFIKKSCKNAEVSKKYRTLIDKIEANSNLIKIKRTKAMDDGLVSLADPKSHQILRVQIETGKPEPPILIFARNYFKINARVTAKEKKNQTQTKEERRIPKPIVPGSFDDKGVPHDFKTPLFSFDSVENQSDEESGRTFKTKFDISSTEDESNQEKSKGKKRKINPEVNMKKKKNKVRKMKSKIQNTVVVDDVEDQVVDFELSD